MELVLDFPIAWVSAVLEPAILAAAESVLFIIEQQDHIIASIQALIVMLNNSLVLKELWTKTIFLTYVPYCWSQG